MSQKADLVLNDGTLDRTYKPSSTTGNTTTWIDRTTYSIAGGQSVVTLKTDQLNAKRNTDKVSLTVALPKVVNQTVNGVARDAVVSVGRYVGGNFIFPGDWNADDRNILLNITRALMAHSVVHDATVNRDAPY